MQSSDGSQAAATSAEQDMPGETQPEEKVAPEAGQAETVEAQAAPTKQPEEKETSEVSEEAIRAWLKREEVREKFVYADTALCDEIIARYLAELDGVSHVPVLRGYCAVRPVAKPRSLDEAGRIWRENFMGKR